MVVAAAAASLAAAAAAAAEWTRLQGRQRGGHRQGGGRASAAACRRSSGGPGPVRQNLVTERGSRTRCGTCGGARLGCGWGVGVLTGRRDSDGRDSD